ncbi:hypothetical protein BACPLE_02028 [Phocaeicola plebeius DSM 17135]|uniref:Uncharacterized protein n=1 Tax=Phocaeicola plebeius (strain DSM 17135 / JCM 12973 / CCUG 54634 / M2) TaxID=484018 RepID=B5CZ71_PHOPM|nr:hypothetical protein [Phocaeicola plebeius]EDY95752.1 hypothetical protein BACPLE_02028 [Phocaeicola plebeius DSM 17135]
MKMSEQSRASIVSALKTAICRYASEGDETVVTDIHLQPNSESGELIIFDDDDQELSRTIINEWVEYESDDFYTVVEPILRAEVEALKESGKLEKLCLMKPYSFVLVDEDKETVAELLLVDEDETLLLNDELLKGLDEELDAFLKDLLER